MKRDNEGYSTLHISRYSITRRRQLRYKSSLTLVSITNVGQQYVLLFWPSPSNVPLVVALGPGETFIPAYVSPGPMVVQLTSTRREPVTIEIVYSSRRWEEKPCVCCGAPVVWPAGQAKCMSAPRCDRCRKVCAVTGGRYRHRGEAD